MKSAQYEYILFEIRVQTISYEEREDAKDWRRLFGRIRARACANAKYSVCVNKYRIMPLISLFYPVFCYVLCMSFEKCVLGRFNLNCEKMLPTEKSSGQF